MLTGFVTIVTKEYSIVRTYVHNTIIIPDHIIRHAYVKLKPVKIEVKNSDIFPTNDYLFLHIFLYFFFSPRRVYRRHGILATTVVHDDSRLGTRCVHILQTWAIDFYLVWKSHLVVLRANSKKLHSRVFFFFFLRSSSGFNRGLPGSVRTMETNDTNNNKRTRDRGDSILLLYNARVPVILYLQQNRKPLRQNIVFLLFAIIIHG